MRSRASTRSGTSSARASSISLQASALTSVPVHGSGLGFALYGHLPVLIGLNLSERVSVVLSPGLMSLWGPHDLFVQSAPGPRLFWRVGAGVDVRLSQSFALMPEVTLVRTFVPLGADTNASHLTFVVAGVAARAGRLPDYSR
jgi:hypothetical protein